MNISSQSDLIIALLGAAAGAGFGAISGFYTAKWQNRQTVRQSRVPPLIGLRAHIRKAIVTEVPLDAQVSDCSPDVAIRELGKIAERFCLIYHEIEAAIPWMPKSDRHYAESKLDEWQEQHASRVSRFLEPPRSRRAHQVHLEMIDEIGTTAEWCMDFLNELQRRLESEIEKVNK